MQNFLVLQLRSLLEVGEGLVPRHLQCVAERVPGVAVEPGDHVAKAGGGGQDGGEEQESGLS